MRFQQVKQLSAAMDELSGCADRDALLPTLLVHVRNLGRAEAAWIWLIVDPDQLTLQHVAGGTAVSATSSPLYHISMSSSGGRAIAQRLRRLGYRSILVLPLHRGPRISGMVAIGAKRPRRLSRTDAEICRMLVQHTSFLLGRRQNHALSDSVMQPSTQSILSPAEMQREHIYLLNTLISRIAHGLNNTMVTINGRVELLLNKPHDQSTMQHLGAALRATLEAIRLVRHIQALTSSQAGSGAVMIDLNQLVRDSLQIARATWFLEFRRMHLPIDLTANLRPLPALAVKGPDLRIALLCLLQHVMDTLSPGSRLVVRTWTESEGIGESIAISVADESDQAPQDRWPSLAQEGEGIGLLLSGAQTADSQRALAFVETTVHNLGGRMTVVRNAAGGTTTTLRFSIGDAHQTEGNANGGEDFTSQL